MALGRPVVATFLVGSRNDFPPNSDAICFCSPEVVSFVLDCVCWVSGLELGLELVFPILSVDIKD